MTVIDGAVRSMLATIFLGPAVQLYLRVLMKLRELPTSLLALSENATIATLMLSN